MMASPAGPMRSTRKAVWAADRGFTAGFGGSSLGTWRPSRLARTRARTLSAARTSSVRTRVATV
eukprot:CAMPEP_0185202138 /NCGR_PEP_ID=MMETSP1140-20130426/50513_1 /TAXON_ID=298111 /ORGANISM="Pavlova sp., Strain CCMP459" /LENGTH=63 /DNA_ID=CAMNT_0027769559 /DNA_START=292 /DNA_END=479 /DNA_ORIENTATION=+